MAMTANDDIQSDWQFLSEYGVTWKERLAVEAFARIVVNVGDRRGELFRQLNNQIINYAKDVGLDPGDVIRDYKANVVNPPGWHVSDVLEDG